MPFFSIIIPVYNVAPYLRECLDSVLAQDFPDWEAICVDDGSADGSGAILDEYAATDKRFRVIHQANAGVGAARNKGLDEAKGSWILFLDADDVWHQDLLSTVASMINAYPNEKLFRFGYEPFEEEFAAARSDAQKEKYSVIDISKAISMHDFSYYYFCCYAYRRDLFDGTRFPHYIRGEDRCVLNKIQLERADRIVAADCTLYGYRQRPGSAVHAIPSRQVLQDEMDHRLDIMEMIDRSGKQVVYARNGWLEGYFTRNFYHIAKGRLDCSEVLGDWRFRLKRLAQCKGISAYGRFVARSCMKIKCKAWAWLVCYALPRLREGGSPIRAIKRTLFK